MKKTDKEKETNLFYDPDDYMDQIQDFLNSYLPKTVCKQIVCMILICSGLSNQRIEELTGYCDRSIRNMRNKLMAGENIYNILSLGVHGRKGKLSDVEDELLAELEAGDYKNRQEVADMIQEKFNISVSVWGVGRFLRSHGCKLN